MFYVDNEAWGSEAHIHLLTLMKNIIIPDMEKNQQKGSGEKYRY